MTTFVTSDIGIAAYLQLIGITLLQCKRLDSGKFFFEFAQPDVCKERSIEPAKSFSGRVNLRTDPELHRLMSQAAAEAGKSLNSWSIEQLEQAMHS